MSYFYDNNVAVFKNGVPQIENCFTTDEETWIRIESGSYNKKTKLHCINDGGTYKSGKKRDKWWYSTDRDDIRLAYATTYPDSCPEEWKKSK